MGRAGSQPVLRSRLYAGSLRVLTAAGAAQRVRFVRVAHGGLQTMMHVGRGLAAAWAVCSRSHLASAARWFAICSCFLQ